MKEIINRNSKTHYMKNIVETLTLIYFKLDSSLNIYAYSNQNNKNTIQSLFHYCSLIPFIYIISTNTKFVRCSVQIYLQHRVWQQQDLQLEILM